MAADPITAVVEVWKNNASLCKQASSGVMAVVGSHNDISRREVCSNAAIIDPVIVHMGNSTEAAPIFHGCL